MIHRCIAFCLAPVIAAILTTSCYCNTEEETVEKDKKVSGTDRAKLAWTDLDGTDDKSHSLKDYPDAELVVVVFTCNHCPVAKAYEDRMIQFVKDYQKKKVQVVAINVNNLEVDKLPKMKERAKEKEFNFPYLYDPSQEIARAYGAKVTPHVFLLNQDQRIVYRGAIDDSQNAKNVTKHYLRDAVDAVLAGEEPKVDKNQPFGCSIKYE